MVEGEEAAGAVCDDERSASLRSAVCFYSLAPQRSAVRLCSLAPRRSALLATHKKFFFFCKKENKHLNDCRTLKMQNKENELSI